MFETMSEKIKDYEPRLMTQATFDTLLKKRQELANRLKELGANHESGHQRQALHDNPAGEQEKNNLRARLALIGDLSCVTIVTPPNDISFINIGSQVRLLFEDGYNMEGIILGPDDAQYSDGFKGVEIISYKSPLGCALLNRPANSEVELVLPQPQKVKILDISKPNL